MPTEEQILKQTIDDKGQSIPTELQIPAETQETSRADTVESIGREAEDGAVDAWLAGLKDDDIPTDEKDLIKFVRDNVPRLEKQDDAAVLAAWRGETPKGVKAPTPTGVATTPTVGTPLWTPQGYKVYNKDGTAHAEYSPEIQEFLEKSIFGYQAMGVEQKRSFAEVIRNASMGHLNHQRYTSLEGDASKLREELTTVNAKNTSLSDQFDIYDRAIMAATQGNLQLLEALIEEAKSTTPSASDPRIAELEAEVAQFKSRQAGDAWIAETRPYLRQLANRYGVAPTDYAKFEEFAVDLVSKSPERTQAILQYDLPMSLIAGGYTEGGAAVATPVAGPSAGVTNGPIEGDLTAGQIATNEANAKIQSLTAELENIKNERAAGAAAGGPPASGAGGEGTGGSDLDVPDFKNRSEAMAWLRT